MSFNIQTLDLGKFTQDYSTLHRDKLLNLSYLRKKCNNYINEHESIFSKLEKNPMLSEQQYREISSHYEELFRIKNILTINIESKKHYYTSTRSGKISAFFHPFLKKIRVTPSLDKAEKVMRRCEDALVKCTEILAKPKEISQANDPALEMQEIEINTQTRSLFDILRMHAMNKKEPYFHCIGLSENPSHILIAKPDGDIYVLPRHEAGSLIGSGSSRRVYKGYLFPYSASSSTPPKEVAILTTAPEKNMKERTYESRLTNDVQRIKEEQNCLKQLKNITGVIHNHDFFITQIADRDITFAIADLYPEGNLKNFLQTQEEAQKPLSQADKLDLIQSLHQTITSLHKKNKIHRDLKDENILIKHDEEGKLKTVLIDFECCMDFNDAKRKKEIASSIECWSPEYVTAYLIADTAYRAKEKSEKRAMSDEEINKLMGNGIKTATSSAMDIWALGLIYYRIWYGKDLFSSSAFMPRQAKIEALKSTFKHIDQAFPEKLDDVGVMIKSMLELDPKKRKLLPLPMK